MATMVSFPEARVVLHGISWSLYEQILAEHDEKSSPRFTYDRGELEILVLSYEHETLNRLISDLMVILAACRREICSCQGHTACPVLSDRLLGG